MKYTAKLEFLADESFHESSHMTACSVPNTWRRIWPTTIRAVGVAVLLNAGTAWAQLVGDLPPVTYPAIPQAAASLQYLIPKGWKLIARKTGDLNGDRKADAALLLRMTSKANVLPIEDSKESFDTNPYMIVVAFSGGEGIYRTAASNHSLIPRPEIPYTGDTPPDADTLKIEKRSLVVHFEYLRGWESYRFRWNERDFALTGYDSGGNSGGCIEQLSINYISGKALWENTPMSKNKGRPVARKVKGGSLPTLSTIDSSSFTPPETVAGDEPPCR